MPAVETTRRDKGLQWNMGREKEGEEGDPVVTLPPKIHFSCAQAPAFPRSSQIFLDYKNTNNILKLDGKSLEWGGYLLRAREVKEKEVIFMEQVTALCL